MQARVLYFGMAFNSPHEIEELIEFSSGTTVGQMIEKLCVQNRRVSTMNGRVSQLVNGHFAGLDVELHDGDEITLLPGDRLDMSPESRDW